MNVKLILNKEEYNNNPQKYAIVLEECQSLTKDNIYDVQTVIYFDCVKIDGEFCGILDSCLSLFNLFYVFNAAYPIESREFWIIIEKLFYRWKATDDEISETFVEIHNTVGIIPRMNK